MELRIWCLAAALSRVTCYSPSARSRHRQRPSRREALVALFAPVASGAAAATGRPCAARAQSTTDASVSTLQEATGALSSLLENWEKATVDCTYADVPRELLEAKNKERLLEKASEFALFDKSTSIVSCKRSNRTVRDYLGATGIGPLVGAEKRLLRGDVVDRVDPDGLDDYFSAVEAFSQALSRATSLAYTAGTADFDSMNNFEKGKEDGAGSNLDQAREAIAEANAALKQAVALIS